MVRSQSAHAGALIPPSKSLGQHFLVDQGIISKIIAGGGFRDSDLVLEIGPGKGALTVPLARSVGRVVGIETDSRLVRLLQDRLARMGIENVTLIPADILKWDFGLIREFTGSKIQVIGNLPYNISTPFLEKLIDNRRFVKRAVLMFQTEVAGRITASPGSRTYGALTLLIRYHASSHVLLKVGKEAFYPEPKISSTVIGLDFEDPYPSDVDEAVFKKVVKGAFAHRRKTILNSLKTIFPAGRMQDVGEALTQCGIDSRRRAETLDMDDFLCLGTALTRYLLELST